MRFLVLILLSTFLSIDANSFLTKDIKSFQGIVRIKNTQSISYDVNTGVPIKDSQNTILKIKNIFITKKNSVALVADASSRYGVLLVIFDESISAKNFKNLLKKNVPFEIEVNPESLQLFNENFVSVLMVEADNIFIYSKDLDGLISLKNY